MPLRSRLMGSGASPELAIHTCGGVAAVTAAGTVSTDAAALPNAFALLTGASNAGVILRADLNPGESQGVFNESGNTLKIYPPAGGKINSGTTDAAVTLANGKMAIFFSATPLLFHYVVTG